ncbi:LpqB family beta-propeller domain-containing protein [Cryobacterium tepidiphilum]|uniref:GerMN domain-containing protein n=1 Tax=Cryobacterium tepidiphilum TaxID=2486026 RepID=A0A3M8KWR8_9MICO|nr:LpqB family beta-propeller domain-containing protein [Cryobacterium tepidiphilum]RNE56794.1 hypothetical protein EEJ31_12805 [Cryobacterium tepidiphilum]
MRKRSALAAALVALAVSLTGCTGIPSDGRVHEGQAAPQGDGPAAVFLPSRPQKDATKEAILRGFIDAASSPENKYEIAREFLTPTFREEWKPDAGVTVDGGGAIVPLTVDDHTMQVSVDPVAEVNASGEYREFDSTKPTPLRYTFAMVDGQWRISGAPDGIVIDENTFSYVFSPQSLYFFDPSFNYLVPDLRWFPRGATAPTRIVKALLAGPASWLDQAVITAFPEGTELTADAVQVVGRDAKVDLNQEALGADRITAERMKYQLENSLPSGLSVTVTVNQNTQDIGELGPDAPVVDPHVDARPLILRKGTFGFLPSSGTDLEQIPGLSGVVAGLDPTAVSVSPGQTRAAVLTSSGVFGVETGEKPELLDPRSGLIAPSIDTFGYVWSVPSERPDELVVYGPAGDAVPVKTPWKEFTGISSLKVSRDGTRLVAVLRSATETRFVAAAISRDSGRPTGVGDPLLLASDIGTARDAAWVDDLTVAVLTTDADDQPRILTQEIAGLRSPLEPPPDSVGIVGGNSVRELRTLTSDGRLELQRGAGWQERIDDVTLMATQQGVTG